MAGTTSGIPSWDYVLLLAILLVGAGSVMVADPAPSQDLDCHVIADPDPSQDLDCVADQSLTSPLVNGYPSKPLSSVSAQDFMCTGFQKPARSIDTKPTAMASAGDGGNSKWKPPTRSMSKTEAPRAATTVRIFRSSGAANCVEFRHD